MNPFEYDSKFDVDEFLEQSNENERQRLENELQRIEDQLIERDQLHKETLGELESKKAWYTERLETLYKQSRGTTGERKKLKSRIEEFYQRIRKEKRSRWRDRQELELERQEVLRALEELDDDSLFDLF